MQICEYNPLFFPLKHMVLWIIHQAGAASFVSYYANLNNLLKPSNLSLLKVMECNLSSFYIRQFFVPAIYFHQRPWNEIQHASGAEGHILCSCYQELYYALESSYKSQSCGEGSHKALLGPFSNYFNMSFTFSKSRNIFPIYLPDLKQHSSQTNHIYLFFNVQLQAKNSIHS